MANVDAIAGASRRNEALHFGVADYAASTRAQTTSIGGPNPAYAVLTDPAPDPATRARRERHWGDMWHYALARMVVAARAHGLRPIDGPFGDFSDPEGYRAAARARRGARLRGQMGDPPEPDRARQRGHGAARRRGREGAADPRRDGRPRAPRARVPSAWTAG